MSARGPRLLIPSALVGVFAVTLAVVLWNAGRYPGEARAILVGSVAVVVADGWLAFRALRRLDARMLTPTSATAGTTFHARATITGVTRPATVDPLFADEERAHFDGPAPFPLACHATHRGTFNHLLVEVRCRSPLGLWACARRIAVLLPEPLYVGPAPRACPTEPVMDERAGQPGAAGSAGGRLDLMRSTRPYVPGDSRRHVHWPATAHEGRLMVREPEVAANRLTALVADLHGPGPAAEEALGRLATAASAAIARDGRVRLITTEATGGESDAPIPRSILVPAARLRSAANQPGPTSTVDRTETSATGILRRLATAATAPPDLTGAPPGAVLVSDRGRPSPTAGRETQADLAEHEGTT